MALAPLNNLGHFFFFLTNKSPAKVQGRPGSLRIGVPPGSLPDGQPAPPRRRALPAAKLQRVHSLQPGPSVCALNFRFFRFFHFFFFVFRRAHSREGGNVSRRPGCLCPESFEPLPLLHRKRGVLPQSTSAGYAAICTGEFRPVGCCLHL